MLVCYDQIRNLTLSIMIELPVVIWMIDHSDSLAPEGGRSAAIKIGSVVHSKKLADSCSLPDSSSITLTRETAVNNYQIDVTLLICSDCSTRVSSVIELS